MKHFSKIICFDWNDVLTIPIETKNNIDKYRNMFYIIQKYRKKNKVSWEESASKNGFNENEINFLIDLYLKINIPNPQFKIIIHQCRKLGLKCIITSNQSNMLIEKWLILYKLNSIISNNDIYSPELLNWIWKPNQLYYIQLSKRLNISLSNLILVDNDWVNVVAIKQIGGSGFIYNATQKLAFPWDKLERIMI